MADDPSNSVAAREEAVLKFWQENKIFEKSLSKPSPKGEFVFYDGPPFATGLPHYGHLLGSTAKDLIPRYKTMQGFHVRRRWGWDTHGLPVENIVEKKLGLKNKKDILELGIEKFNELCRAQVLEYVHDWKEYVERLGRWVDFDNSYKTMDATYTESVWWALKQIHEKGLLYEGRKVLMYCPHCETPLAKAEIAMDNSYKDVIEDAVTVKLKIVNCKLKIADTPAYLLAWTTTPWTLPANIALAVGPEIEYALVSHPDSVSPSLKVREGREGYVVAVDLIPKIFGKEAKEIKIEKKFLGKELVGLLYEPLFDVPKMKGEKSYKVYAGDFVNTDEGTGIVHTAVIYGEDDYQLGLREGLPQVPLLNANGTYNTDAPEFLHGQYIKKAEKIIIEDLEKRGLMFAKAPNTHSYPHCYRCGTPLIYNALSSWFINIQKVKARMIELNEKINWVPEHLKHGRFLNIVENAPDWTISRNRFWASPLPIWKCLSCSKVTVIGSLKELESRSAGSGNKYFLMRHGESVANTKGVIDAVPGGSGDVLTENGKKQVAESAKTIGPIDIIFHSPFNRSKQSAQIVAVALGLSRENIREDERIGEYEAKGWEGKSWQDLWDRVPNAKDNMPATKGKMFKFFAEMDKEFMGKKILVISHDLPMLLLLDSDKMFANAEVRGFDYKVLPRNARGEVDLHRPYIDEIKLKCECGGEMMRVPEVVDCWVESGSMPFAEYHYPFENEKEFEKRSPGDYIAEYIAQTRTWFYYMLAVSTALFDREPFKNVVTTGTILAGDGNKMSKSLGNYTDPLQLIDKYGADAYRYYMMTGVVMQGEDTLFKDDEVKEVYQRMINILWNVVTFYTTYADSDPKVRPRGGPEVEPSSPNVLDRWILARLAQLHQEVTENLDKYDTVKAGRPIRDFVTDLSTWYIRRSRDRFKSDPDPKVRPQGGPEVEPSSPDRDSAINTTRYVLLELAKIIAPFMPFIAEQVYKAAGGELESVHLEDWTDSGIMNYELGITNEMQKVREVVTLGLEARQKVGVKVRQPLSKIIIHNSQFIIQNEQLLALIRDELNVKEVIVDSATDVGIELDTTVTPELKLEGEMRDLVRAVQEKRKEAGLQPSDRIILTLPSSLRPLASEFETEIKRAVQADSLSFADIPELSITKI